MFTRRTAILIHYFVEKFQGYYKNGSAGTRDYRWFSSFHIALITTMHLLYGLLSSTEIYLVGGEFYSLLPLLFPYHSLTKMSCIPKSLSVFSFCLLFGTSSLLRLAVAIGLKQKKSSSCLFHFSLLSCQCATAVVSLLFSS